jgi:hypothetical protein
MSEDRDQPVEETTEEVEGHNLPGQNVGQNVGQNIGATDEGDDPDFEGHSLPGQNVGQNTGQNIA